MVHRFADSTRRTQGVHSCVVSYEESEVRRARRTPLTNRNHPMYKQLGRKTKGQVPEFIWETHQVLGRICPAIRAEVLQNDTPAEQSALMYAHLVWEVAMYASGALSGRTSKDDKQQIFFSGFMYAGLEFRELMKQYPEEVADKALVQAREIQAQIAKAFL